MATNTNLMSIAPVQPTRSTKMTSQNTQAKYKSPKRAGKNFGTTLDKINAKLDELKQSVKDLQEIDKDAAQVETLTEENDAAQGKSKPPQDAPRQEENISPDKSQDAKVSPETEKSADIFLSASKFAIAQKNFSENNFEDEPKISVETPAEKILGGNASEVDNEQSAIKFQAIDNPAYFFVMNQESLLKPVVDSGTVEKPQVEVVQEISGTRNLQMLLPQTEDTNAQSMLQLLGGKSWRVFDNLSAEVQTPIQTLQPTIQAAEVQTPIQPSQPTIQPAEVQTPIQPSQPTIQSAEVQTPIQPLQPTIQLAEVQTPIQPSQPINQLAEVQTPIQVSQPINQAAEVQTPIQAPQPTNQAAEVQTPIQPLQPTIQSAEVQTPIQASQPINQAAEVQTPIQAPQPINQSAEVQTPIQASQPTNQPAEVQTPIQPLQPINQSAEVQTPIQPPQPINQPAEVQTPIQPPQPINQSAEVQTPIQPLQPINQPAEVQTPIQAPQPINQSAEIQTPIQPLQPTIQSAEVQTPIQPSQLTNQPSEVQTPIQPSQLTNQPAEVQTPIQPLQPINQAAEVQTPIQAPQPINQSAEVQTPIQPPQPTIQSSEVQTSIQAPQPIIQSAEVQTPIQPLQPIIQQEVAERPALQNFSELLGVNVQVEENSTAAPVAPPQSTPQQFEQNNPRQQGEQNLQNQIFQPATAEFQSQQVSTGGEGFATNLATTNAAPQIQQATSTQAPDAPLPTPQEDFNVPAQIVNQARLIRTAENTEMVIKLNPEHLGELTLRVSVSPNGAVNASFHSDNAQVRTIIENSLVQLRHDLNNVGLKVENVQVYAGLSDGGLMNGQGGQAWQQNRRQTSGNRRIDFDSLERDVDAAAPAYENSTSEGVDYSV